MPDMTQLWLILLQAEGAAPKEFDQGRVIRFTPYQDWLAMLIGGVIFALLIGLAYFLMRRTKKEDWRSEPPPEGTEATFTRLCEANSLSNSEGYLLRKMVHDLKLENPLLPFVDARPYAAYEHGQGGSKRAAIEKVKAKIFS